MTPMYWQARYAVDESALPNGVTLDDFGEDLNAVLAPVFRDWVAGMDAWVKPGWPADEPPDAEQAD